MKKKLIPVAVALAIAIAGVAGGWFAHSLTGSSTISNSDSQPKLVLITQLTAQNQKQVTDEITNSKLPVFIELCTPDLCKVEDTQLEQVAGAYAGKVLFVQANPLTDQGLAQLAAQLVGTYAYPMALVLNTNGAITPAPGLLSAADLQQLLQAGLTAKAPATTGGSSSSSSTGSSSANH